MFDLLALVLSAPACLITALGFSNAIINKIDKMDVWQWSALPMMFGGLILFVGVNVFVLVLAGTIQFNCT